MTVDLKSLEVGDSIETVDGEITFVNSIAFSVTDDIRYVINNGFRYTPDGFVYSSKDFDLDNIVRIIKANEIKIPTWEEIRWKDDFPGSLNPLEEFVYHNDPANEEDSAEFMEGLAKVVKFIQENS